MPTTSIIAFQKQVAEKYIIYNSLFSALPYSGVANAGTLLPLLLQQCQSGYESAKSPADIINHFFATHTKLNTLQEKLDSLFKFVQYIERQVVLFDAIEDAAFTSVNNVSGDGSIKNLMQQVKFLKKEDSLRNKLKKFRVRIVLTAHPTQFYPANVLGIIHDLGEAIAKNNFQTIGEYIQQLGITPFFNKKQPTPYDEAINLMWYLENIFYHACGDIYTQIVTDIFDGQYEEENPFIELGFWPGGDRDGNPFVDAKTTLQVAEALRRAIMVCYYRDIRKLKRRLTFSEIDMHITQLEKDLYENVFQASESTHITKAYLLDKLNTISSILTEKHFGLFKIHLDKLIHKVKIFGTHFAALDIRQDSRVHQKTIQAIDQTLKENSLPALLPNNYDTLSEAEKIHCLNAINTVVNPTIIQDKLSRDTLESICAIKEIQRLNGAAGCHRYIISNCQSALHVIEVLTLFRIAGFRDGHMEVDIVPLFETISDLAQSAQIMEQLYTTPSYLAHVQYRNQQQTIMLGFSDGTKDGGYLQANWSINTAKEVLTAVSRKYQIVTKFFDGRGGPPSRGGGRTHQFYASLSNEIENEEIQLTIQGQTITSNFGTKASARYNIEQLLSAGLGNKIFASKQQISILDREVLNKMSQISYDAYCSLKQDPQFLAYLQKFSPILFYGKSNIASRPTSRKSNTLLQLEDLRAIPFVGSWTQMKQNVPGFYGLGTALMQLKQAGLWEDAKEAYQNTPFFRTLINNSMMSMLKCYFPATQYIQQDPEFGQFWKKIEQEYTLTEKLVLELAGMQQLMEDDTAGNASIKMRENIVLPLLTIQQYALQLLQDKSITADQQTTIEKLITRSMFGIINAARNAV